MVCKKILEKILRVRYLQQNALWKRKFWLIRPAQNVKFAILNWSSSNGLNFDKMISFNFIVRKKHMFLRNIFKKE